jgi:hypothetical protein
MPIYLSLETRMQLEVWFVLLRCYATPELYGPPSSDPLDAFRCHRSLKLRIVEAKKLNRPVSSGDSMREKEMDSYCEVVIEGEIRGKTSIKRATSRPLWNEDFEFMYSSHLYPLTSSDLPEHLDDIEIHFRHIRRNRDSLLGKVTVNVTETELGTAEQAWHTIVYNAPNGLSVERVGELDLKYKVDELVILMTSDYSELRKVIKSSS